MEVMTFDQVDLVGVFFLSDQSLVHQQLDGCDEVLHLHIFHLFDCTKLGCIIVRGSGY